jgi:dihydroflavonol-4-reductase
MLPAAPATLVGAIAGYAFKLLGRDAPVCREMVRTLLQGHNYDGSRAERELGLVYRRVEDTLGRTILWLAEQGLVPPSVTEGGGA